MIRHVAALVLVGCGTTGGGVDGGTDATGAPQALVPANCNVDPDGGVVACPSANPACLTVTHLSGIDAGTTTTSSCVSLGACASDPTCACVKGMSLSPDCFVSIDCAVGDAGMQLQCTTGG